MTTDGVAAGVAAVHSPITTPPPAGTPAMASVPTNLPGTLNVTYTDKFDSRLLWYEDHIVGWFLVIVGVTSLLGNGSTMVMFYRRLRQLTAAEVLLLNMAVMHMCLAIFSYPAPTVSSFAHRWLFGNLGCQMYGFVCYTLGVATIISMAALAVVRYLKTCTHTYSRRMTAQHMKVVLLAVYLYSIFWTVLPLFSLKKAYEVEPFGTSCTFHWASNEKAAQVYILAVVVFVVVVPFVVMLWCYLEILLMVRRNHRKKIVMAKRSGNSQGRTELQLTLVSALVCLGYLVAWLPYTVVSVLYCLLRREGPVYLTLAPVLLAKSSCAYNPIIYIFVNARYRQQMVGILCEAFQTLFCCCSASETSDTTAQAPETSQDLKSSRTFAMNQESMGMEEVQPLTNAPTTAASTRCLNTPEDTTRTTPATTPSHTLPQPNSNEEAASPHPPGHDVSATPPSGDGQAAEASSPLNSPTVFHPLYGFPGSSAGTGKSEASHKSSQQQSPEGTKDYPGSAPDDQEA